MMQPPLLPPLNSHPNWTLFSFPLADEANLEGLDQSQRKFKAAALRKEAIDLDAEVITSNSVPFSPPVGQ